MKNIVKIGAATLVAFALAAPAIAGQANKSFAFKNKNAFSKKLSQAEMKKTTGALVYSSHTENGLRYIHATHEYIEGMADPFVSWKIERNGQTYYGVAYRASSDGSRAQWKYVHANDYNAYWQNN